jgi:hypothetical protein
VVADANNDAKGLHALRVLGVAVDTLSGVDILGAMGTLGVPGILGAVDILGALNTLGVVVGILADLVVPPALLAVLAVLTFRDLTFLLFLDLF